ncbi:MAG: DUF1080 domain-containing protein [Phaeodactylibacter sp.]|nr:DUF1080 domain-containing protein [Phaeodactylibacter sp.]MCB9293772.1 DUF1080 domain-containing protein [Lewinellaceae bacterium]
MKWTNLIIAVILFSTSLAGQEIDPKLTEVWEPVPEKVTPGIFPSNPPSDAIILFDGTDLSQWRKPVIGYGGSMAEIEALAKKRAAMEAYEEKDADWEVKDGALIVVPGKGHIETRKAFGDIQLHIEWLSPADPGKEGQGYSNSGIFLMGHYEIQVLNSYENPTYPNGQAGALYKQSMPLVNACRPPGEWQSYDIIFMAPKFAGDGSLLRPATVTAFHNGVLIQNHYELKGPCIYRGEPYYVPHPEKLPLILQDHSDRVRFRNIWVREL